MTGEIDGLDFVLAERLGMSLGDVRAMPYSDFVEWGAWFKYTNAMDDLNARTNQSRVGRRVG